MLEFKIHVAQTVGEVWTSRKTNPDSFSCHFMPLFPCAGKSKKMCVSLAGPWLLSTLGGDVCNVMFPYQPASKQKKKENGDPMLTIVAKLNGKLINKQQIDIHPHQGWKAAKAGTYEQENLFVLLPGLHHMLHI